MLTQMDILALPARAHQALLCELVFHFLGSQHPQNPLTWVVTLPSLFRFLLINEGHNLQVPQGLMTMCFHSFNTISCSLCFTITYITMDFKFPIRCLIGILNWTRNQTLGSYLFVNIHWPNSAIIMSSQSPFPNIYLFHGEVLSALPFRVYWWFTSDHCSCNYQ